MSISIDYSELAALSDRLAGAGKRITPLAEAELHRAGQELLDRAQANAPVLTGELRSSGHLGTIGPLGVEVSFDSEHAGYVEEGTSVMAPEPYLGPAADTTIPSLDAQLAAAGMKALL